jgi:hypothetical protein
MSDRPIQIGDRVITMQMPGIFVVTARRGAFVEIASDDGVVLTVSDASLRRMPPDPAPDDGADASDA